MAQKYGAFEFECECKAKTEIEFIVPGMFEIKLLPVECSGCRSDWEVRLRGTPEGPKYSHRLIGPTRRLQDVLEKRKADKLKNMPQKKGLFFPVTKS